MRRNIWKDPIVLEALQERDATDIAILDCPRCGRPGYYNEGSHFTCDECKVTFICITEEEEAPEEMAFIRIDDVRRLSDCIAEEDVP